MSVLADLLRGIPFGSWLLVLFRPIGLVWDGLINILPYINSRLDFLVVFILISSILDFTSLVTFSEQIALIEPFMRLVYNLLVVVYDLIKSVPYTDWVFNNVIDPFLHWLAQELLGRYI